MVSISVANAGNSFAIQLVVITLAVTTVRDVAAAAETHAIVRSVDRGRSWVRSDSGIPEGSRINCFTSLTDVLIAGTDSGVFVSTDDAHTWQRPTGSIAARGRVISLATSRGSVFAGTDGKGLLVSEDDGKTWTRNDSFPARKTLCLLVHDGKLYAGTDNLGVFCSSDEGNHWTEFTAGLPAQPQVFDLEAVRGKLFAGLYSKGLFVWNEQIRQWERTGNVVPLVLAASRNSLIAGHNPGGIYRSEDLGVTWSKASDAAATLKGELPSDAPVWALAASEKLVIAGASAGIYYSEDHGRTWTRSRIGISKQSPGIAFLITPELVLAAITIGEYGRR